LDTESNKGIKKTGVYATDEEEKKLRKSSKSEVVVALYITKLTSC